MPVRSLNSSVIKWPDLQEVKTAIVLWVNKLVGTHPEILRIGYIGSYARGDWGVGSDLDLIIIVEKSDTPFWRRPLTLEMPESPVPVEMIIYTLAEWQAMAGENNLFYRTVEKEVKWLFTKHSD